MSARHARGALAAPSPSLLLGALVTLVTLVTLLTLAACGPATPPASHAAAAATSASAPAAPIVPCTSATPEVGDARGTAAAADRILRVEVRGNVRTPTRSICAIVHTRAGGPVAEVDVRRDTRELFESGLFDDVQVASEPLDGGRAIVFLVHERPMLRRLALTGAAPADADRIQGLLGREGDLFDGETLRKQLEDVRLDYVGRGYRSVAVRWKTTPAPENQLDLSVEVTEGPLATIDWVQLRGVATKAREAELFSLMETSQGHCNVPGKIYREDAFERGRVRMSGWYYDHGMLDAHVGTEEVTLSPDRGSLTIAIPIEEGPVYRLSEVHCAGDLAEGEARCLELLGVRAGDVFDRSAMLRGMERIREQQARKGRGTQIDPASEIDRAKRTVALRLTIAR